MIGHDQHQHRHGHQNGQQRIGARNAELIFPMHNAADQNGKPRNAVQHQHNSRQQGIAHQGGIAIRTQHQGNDQSGFNHGDRQCQDQTTKGLTHAQRHHFSVMHRRHHITEQCGQNGNGQKLQPNLAEAKPCGNAGQGGEDEEKRNAI